MDEIDITSSGFSLDIQTNIPEIIPTISESIPEILSNTLLDNCPASYEDYTIYIYIGMFVFFLVSAGILYQIYISKQKRVTFQDKLDDCYGGVCDMV